MKNRIRRVDGAQCSLVTMQIISKLHVGTGTEESRCTGQQIHLRWETMFTQKVCSESHEGASKHLTLLTQTACQTVRISQFGFRHGTACACAKLNNVIAENLIDIIATTYSYALRARNLILCLQRIALAKVSVYTLPRRIQRENIGSSPVNKLCATNSNEFVNYGHVAGFIYTYDVRQ